MARRAAQAPAYALRALKEDNATQHSAEHRGKAYAMLLKYSWYDNGCFPGQATLVQDMGAGERSIRTYLKELESGDLLEITRRGLGKTNLYRLHVTVKKQGSPPLTGKIRRS